MSTERNDTRWPPELAKFPADIADAAVDVVERIAWAMPNIEEMRVRVAKVILAERAKAVNDVLDMLCCHELYKYRPGAFKGFLKYARETLCIQEGVTHSPLPTQLREERT